MSKELEPIEALDKLLDGYSRGMAGRSYYDIVREALERLEAIENENPIEALKCLEDLYCEPVDYRSNDKANDYETIKQALLKAEKELKALEIIKEKLVDVFKLYNCKTVEEYNQAQYRDCMLTEEEFNLLKEVLG